MDCSLLLLGCASDCFEIVYLGWNLLSSLCLTSSGRPMRTPMISLLPHWWRTSTLQCLPTSTKTSTPPRSSKPLCNSTSVATSTLLAMSFGCQSDFCLLFLHPTLLLPFLFDLVSAGSQAYGQPLTQCTIYILLFPSPLVITDSKYRFSPPPVVIEDHGSEFQLYLYYRPLFNVQPFSLFSLVWLMLL